MTKEFIETRINEQLAYVEQIRNSKLPYLRQKELVISATHQTLYFLTKLKEMKNQKSSLDKVKEFHELFEHPIGLCPNHEEPLKIRQLRIKLLFEELSELAEASDVKITFMDLCEGYANKAYSEMKGEPEKWFDGDNVDKVEELDAITDIQYVLDGKKLTSGLHTVTSEAFDLIHENNMEKAHMSELHCNQTITINKMIGANVVEKSEGVFLLYNSDWKLTKPHDHKKVDLSHLISNT